MVYDDNNEDSSHSSGQVRYPGKKAKDLEKWKVQSPQPPKATKSPSVTRLGGRKTPGLTMDPPPETDPKATSFTTTKEVLEETGRKGSEEDSGVSLDANPTTATKKAGPAEFFWLRLSSPSVALASPKAVNTRTTPGAAMKQSAAPWSMSTSHHDVKYDLTINKLGGTHRLPRPPKDW